MPGRRGDEVPALLGEQSGNRFGILPAQRLASEDDHTCVDVLYPYARYFVSIVDDGTERGGVDALVARIRSQRHRRLEQGFPRHDIVPAGEILAVAAQVNAGEDDLGTGGADVDADCQQRDMVLDPDGVFFQPLVGIDLEMIMVVIGFPVMRVRHVLAEHMVGERVIALLVLGHGNMFFQPAGEHRYLHLHPLSHGASRMVKRRAVFTGSLRRGSFRKQAAAVSCRKEPASAGKEASTKQRAGMTTSMRRGKTLPKRAERKRRAGENPRLAARNL